MRLLSGCLEGKYALKLYGIYKNEKEWELTRFELCEDGISIISPSIRMTDVLRIRSPLRRVPFVERS